MSVVQTPLRDYPARRIVLIKPSSLGDIVHALPVLTALRRRYPGAYIAWLVNRGYESLLQGHPDLNEILTFDRGAWRKGKLAALWNYGRFLRHCRRQRFDLAIDLQGLLRSGLITAATGAARRVGLSSAREGATWFYTDVVSDPPTLHAVDRYWRVAEALGTGDAPKRFHVPVSESERSWALGLLRDSPRPWLAVAVGARWMTKRWPPQSFAALIRQMQERYGGTAIFIGAGEDAALSQIAAADLRGPFHDLTGKTTLPQLTALLASADVMLANDTGPLHLAAALGRPVVAPYTCTRVEWTGPYGAEGSAVVSRVRCQGSCLKQCDRLECMAELTPARLWPVLQRTLQAWEKNCRSA